MKSIDETGNLYGRLTVLGRARARPSGQCFWICQCVCGKRTEVRGYDLRSHHTESCGCWMKEYNKGIHTIHKKEDAALIRVYQGIKTRVTNPRASNWTRYGGRGIKMCSRWLKSSTAFVADVRAEIGDPPPEHVIDRVDNAGNYAPGNVRWATPQQSARNTRRCRYLFFNGEKRCLAEWCQFFGLSYSRTRKRLDLGWSVAAAFGRP